MTKLHDDLEARFASLEQRNAELEQRNVALERRLAKLEPAPAAPHRHRPVVVTYPTPVARSETLPTDEEFEQLQQIVLTKFPALELAGLAPDEYHRQFQRAFRWLMIVERLEQNRVATDRWLTFWLDKARAYSGNADIGVRPFLAACIAIGDVTIYSNFSNLPFDCSIGLRDCVRGGGDWAAGWRRVLAGNLLMPVAPPKMGGPMRISFR